MPSATASPRQSTASPPATWLTTASIDENQFVSGAWTPSFYVYDGGGSVRQLTNSAQTVTDTYDYDAFGNVVNKTGTTPNNFLYRGEQYDSDLGLYYLRARYYNPATDRFLSRDPEPGNIAIPDTLHKYLYAGGEPVDWVDPSGREAIASYATINRVFALTVAYTGVVLATNPLRHYNSGSLQALGIDVACSLSGDASMLGADLNWAIHGGGGTVVQTGDCTWTFSGKAPAPGAPATDAHTGGQTGSPTGPEDPNGCEEGETCDCEPLNPLPNGVDPYQLRLWPEEPYDRVAQYGRTPTPEQQASVPTGMEFDHDPPLVQHWYEGPGDGSLQGFNLTQEEREAFGASLEHGGPATPEFQRAQGGLAGYSRRMKRMCGF